jgi:preprotein translocase subunit SecB
MATPTHSGFSFDRVWVRSVRFDDTGIDVQPGKKQAEIELGVSMEVPEDNSQALVSLTISVKPKDPKEFNPFEVTVEGRFRPTAEEHKAKLKEFVNRQGAALLLPFAREVIADVTMRSRLGPLLLPPLNVYNITKERAAAAEEEQER